MKLRNTDGWQNGEWSCQIDDQDPAWVVLVQFIGGTGRMAPNNKIFSSRWLVHIDTVSNWSTASEIPKWSPSVTCSFFHSIPDERSLRLLSIMLECSHVKYTAHQKVHSMGEKSKKDILTCSSKHDSNGHNHFCALVSEHHQILSWNHDAHAKWCFFDETQPQYQYS